MTLSFTAAIVPPIEHVESIAMQILAFPADPEIVLKKNLSSRLIFLSKIKFLFATDSVWATFDFYKVFYRSLYLTLQ
jgi:hypothetical protein